MAILKELNSSSSEFLWDGGFDLLLEIGEYRQVVAICTDSFQSAGLSISDRIEVLRKLGEAGYSTLACRLLVDLIEGQAIDLLDKADGATTLHHLDFKAEARTILFDLAVQAQHSTSSALWLADAMLGCGLNVQAASILTSIKRVELDEDQQGHLAEMEDSLRFSLPTELG